MNTPITSEEIEGVSKTSQDTKVQAGPDGFPGEFYQTFKEEMIPMLLEPFRMIERDGIVPSSFYEARITLTPKPKTPQKKREL